MQGHGVVEIEVERIRVAPGDKGPMRPAEYVRVRVRDSGPGIPANVVDQIFRPHFTTKDSGSGLGLAVCEQLVRYHGGYLVAKSEPGEGATFDAWWPAAESRGRRTGWNDPLGVAGPKTRKPWRVAMACWCER